MPHMNITNDRVIFRWIFHLMSGSRIHPACLNSTAASKWNLVFLLNAAVQQLKQQHTASVQIAELRTETASIRSSTTLADDINPHVHDALQSFRTDTLQSIHDKVKSALATSDVRSPDATLPRIVRRDCRCHHGLLKSRHFTNH